MVKQIHYPCSRGPCSLEPYQIISLETFFVKALHTSQGKEVYETHHLAHAANYYEMHELL